VRGRCVPCDREYVDLLHHLEDVHPDIFGGATFARHENGDPVIISPTTDVRVQVVNLDHLADLAVAALPEWDDTAFEVWATGDGHANDNAVHAYLVNLEPAAVLLLLDLARKGSQQ
jgi:hypothetical protein